MPDGNLNTGDIITAFEKHADCFTRDYRTNGGAITLCRGLRTITDQSTNGDIEVPREKIATLQPSVMPKMDLITRTRVPKRGGPKKGIPGVDYPRADINNPLGHNLAFEIQERVSVWGWRSTFKQVGHLFTRYQREAIAKELGTNIFEGYKEP